MIERNLVSIDGGVCDLSNSSLFMEHYKNPLNFVQVIIDEINKDLIYKDVFNSFKTNDLVVLDVGANIGLFSAFIHPRCKRIVCIEPTPLHVEILKDVVSVANLDKVEILEGALTGRTDEVEFHINVTNSTMNSLVFMVGAGYDLVRTVDGYCIGDVLDMFELDYVDFMKLDIEGGEEEVLASESFYEHRDRIRTLYVEVHQGLGANMQRVLDSLKKLGYDDAKFTPYAANQGIICKRTKK